MQTSSQHTKDLLRHHTVQARRPSTPAPFLDVLQALMELCCGGNGMDSRMLLSRSSAMYKNQGSMQVGLRTRCSVLFIHVQLPM